MRCNRFVNSIDWMQVYCVKQLGSIDLSTLKDGQQLQSPFADKWGNHRIYVSCKRKEIIKGYNTQLSLQYRHYTVAHIADEPSSRVVSPTGCAIKLNNAVLYIADWHFILHDIIATLGWRMHNITRVDIATDFNYFLQGLTPRAFLRGYLRKKPRYVRVGSNRWHADGHNDCYTSEVESLRWGSRSSGVSVYLYNKTKELHDVKDKPYIRKMWKDAGLNIDKEVWRVEVSITQQGCGLRSMFDGLIYTLFIDSLSSQQAVDTFASIYLERYFNFRVCAGGKVKHKKDMPRLPLFYIEPTHLVYRPTHLCTDRCTNSTLKTMAKQLVDIREAILNDDAADKLFLIDAIDTVTALIGRLYHVSGDAAYTEKRISEELGRYLQSQQSERYAHDMSICRNLDLIKKHAFSLASEIVDAHKYALHLPYADSPTPRVSGGDLFTT